MRSSSYVLHLFRALLREASYLPDPAARRFFHNHIIRRFRADCPRKKSLNSLLKNDNIANEEKVSRRSRAHLAEARQNLTLLTNANRGSPTHLQKILEMAYGRRGKRKHELLKEVLPDNVIPADETAVQRLAGVVDVDRASPVAKEPRLSDKLLALVKSQKAQKDQLFSKPNVKSTQPDIPETNSWGRPFPRCRAKNLMKRWYSQTLDRLVPPLPVQEWNRLRDLATGKYPSGMPPKRRIRAPGWFELDDKEYEYPKRGWHHLTPRYLRRAWTNVFQQCPLMEWDSAHSRWLVTWGRVERPTGLSVSADTDKSAFGDVDEIGKPMIS